MVNKSVEDNTKINLILAAAQKRFGHYGLNKTTMNEIAEDIGMSKASLYYYFPDKEGLFKEVIRKEHNEFVQDIQKALSGNKDASKLLLYYVKKRQSYFRQFLNLAKASGEAMSSAKPIFNSIFVEMYKDEHTLIVEMLKTGIENGEFRKLDVSYYAELFSITMRGIRSVMIKAKEINMLDETDYNTLEKHSVNIAQLFIKGISI